MPMGIEELVELLRRDDEARYQTMIARDAPTIDRQRLLTTEASGIACRFSAHGAEMAP